MVHSWRPWAIAALVLSPLVAATDHTKTVTQTVSDVKTVTDVKTVSDVRTVTDVKTVSDVKTVTQSVHVPTTKVEWATTIIPTTVTVKKTETVSKCSVVPKTYMENGQLVRRHDETCVVATVVSTLTIGTTYTTKVPTTVQTTVTTTTTKPETKTTITTKATTATATTTKPLTETSVIITTQPPVTRVITTTSLSTRTITTVQPAITVTMTKEGQTVVTTLPAATVTRVEVITLRPETQTLATITVSPAPACPAPTPSGARRVIDTPKNFKWGCAPGYVCNPPKPGGCAVWDSAPPDDFACEPQHCIQAPPIKPVHWAENETGYYPPAEGYFNLDPRAFGLSTGIFEKIEVIKMVDGETQTITTGIWTSQASLSVYPPPTPSADAVHTYKPKKRGAAPVWKPKSQYSSRSFKELLKAAKRGLLKRQVAFEPNAPISPRCFQFCNNAFREAQRRGKIPELCAPGSAFKGELATCLECSDTQLNTTIGSGGRVYLVQEFVGYLSYCDDVGDPTTTAGTNPAPQVSTTDVTTTGQGTGMNTSAPVPISTSTTTTASSTSANVTSSSSSSSSTPTSTSTTSSSASITSSSSSSSISTNTSTSLPIGTISRPPGTTTSRPPTVPAAGASSWRQPTLTTLFLLVATFFAL
ncbi:hypothetical protein RB597_002083 [Gaeumannomyces tritici]